MCKCTKVYSRQKDNAQSTEYTIHTVLLSTGCALNRDLKTCHHFNEAVILRQEEGMRLSDIEGLEHHSQRALVGQCCFLDTIITHSYGRHI